MVSQETVTSNADEYAPELNRFANIQERILAKRLADFDPGKLPTSTGVMRAPDPYAGWNISPIRLPRQQTTSNQPVVNWDAIIANARKPYDELSSRLEQLINQERGNIQSGTSRVTSSLGEMDPMAAYRPTYQSLEAPQAAMTTYLGAIGADPAQVQAQQALANQLMASQAMNQQQFGSAVDTSQTNFRQSQLAEALLNQQRATSALGLSGGAQQAAIGMSAVQQQNLIRQMLLEAQLRMIEQQAENSRNSGSYYGANKFTIDPSSLGLF